MKDIEKKIRSHEYPNPERIGINEADLKLHFQDFGEANQNKISWKDILILVPAWAVLLTADFRDTWLIKGSELRGFYAALLILGTLSYLKIIWWHIQHLLMWLTKKIKEWFRGTSDNLWLSDYCKKYKHLSDSVDKVESIKTIIDAFRK